MDLARPNADLCSAFLCALGDSVVSRCAELLSKLFAALQAFEPLFHALQALQNPVELVPA